MDNVEDIYPLTPTQAGVLYEVLNSGDPAAYFEQVRADVTLEPTLAPVDWVGAWQAVIDRHSALRTGIIWERMEEPVQVVRRSVEAVVEVIDLVDDSDPSQLLESVAFAERNKGFDLRRAPLSRVTVARTSAESWHLIWSFHHIVVDGWSVGLVLDDLAQALAGEQLAGADHVPQFRRHIEWLSSKSGHDDREFWVASALAVDGPTVPDLPGGLGGAGFVPASTMAELGPSTATALIASARQARVTPNVLVQAAWAKCLGAYLGADDVVFGVTMSGRPPEVEGADSIVGMFLSTLPMRVSLADGDGWLARIQANQLELLSRQHCSLADVQRWSGGGPGRPLFESVLVFENHPRAKPRSGVSFDVTEVYEQGDAALTLMIEIADRVRLKMLFDASRFGASQVEQLIEHFLHVLEQLAGDPGAAPHTLQVLTPEDKARQLDVYNATDADIDETTLVDVWRQRVVDAPTAIALVDGRRSWTVGELDELSAAIAANLSALSVGAGDRVGVHMRRSGQTVAVLLGIVRSGAVYVPLDPTYPTSRLVAVVDDCQPALVITDSTGDVGLGSAVVVSAAELLRSQTQSAGDDSASWPTPDLVSSDQFYMTYTSGSTGKPKGVPGHHRGVLERCRWQWETYPFEPGERVLARVTLNFVDHLWELWGALLGGATVVVVPDSAASDPGAIASLIHAHSVRRLVLTPSFLSAFAEALPAGDGRLETLRWVTVSGEAARRRLVDSLERLAPDATLLNFYGMSEATADSTWFDTSDGVPNLEYLPIGRPMRNEKVYLLDSSRELVPEGVVARLHLSGPGLTNGYWNRPELTAERFSDHPFRPGETLFDTGDLARWLPGGILEYRGRVDDQVEVRGSRVELGDVEAALAGVDGLQRSVAAAVDDRETQRLVVFVVTEEGRWPDGSPSVEQAVLAAARLRLPGYMVPSVVVEVDAIPVTPNGKVDRRSLVERFKPGLDLRTIHGSPGAEVDEIASVFSGVVGATVGPRDDFFEAGGHSLDAIRLAARLSKLTGVAVTLPDLLDHPTPEKMASRLADVGDEAMGEFRHLVALAGADRRATPLICVHGGGGHVLVLQELARHVAKHRPFVGVQARGADGRSEPHASVEEMADAYVAELLESDYREPYLLGGYSAGGAIALEMAERLAATGADVVGVLLLDTYHPTLTKAARPSLKALSRIAGLGPVEIARRFAGRLERKRRDSAFAELIEEGRVDDDNIPEALRFERLNRQVAEAFWAYSPGKFNGSAVLLATSEINWSLEHAGPLRGWENSIADLRRIEVSGDHHKFLEHGAEETARCIEQAIALLVGEG